MSNIYREKNLKKLSSPESLNDYICVVKPSVWAVLAVVIALILGICIFASTISIATDTVKCAAIVKNKTLIVYFNEEDRSKVDAGMQLKIVDAKYILPELEIKGKKLFKETDGAILEKLGEGKNYYYCIELAVDIPNGIYDAEIISADINPWKLLIE